MSLESLTDEERTTLTTALYILGAAEEHFRLRDRANAMLYLASTRWSPITKATARSVRELSALLNSESGTEQESDDQILESVELSRDEISHLLD